jgi:hypothetical protein
MTARSDAKTWEEAKREWALNHIFFADPEAPGTCLCGHYPILEHCTLHNPKNGNKVVVGNVCVTQVIGIPADRLFVALRRVKKSATAALTAEVVQFARSEGWINEWELGFYLNTLGKRRASQRVIAKRVEINRKILDRVTGRAAAGEGSSDAN